MIITTSTHTRWDNIRIDAVMPDGGWAKDGYEFVLMLSNGEVVIPLTKAHLLTLLHESETALHHHNEMSGNE